MRLTLRSEEGCIACAQLGTPPPWRRKARGRHILHGGEQPQGNGSSFLALLLLTSALYEAAVRSWHGAGLRRTRGHRPCRCARPPLGSPCAGPSRARPSLPRRAGESRPKRSLILGWGTILGPGIESIRVAQITRGLVRCCTAALPGSSPLRLGPEREARTRRLAHRERKDARRPGGDGEDGIEHAVPGADSGPPRAMAPGDSRTVCRAGRMLRGW